MAHVLMMRKLVLFFQHDRDVEREFLWADKQHRSFKFVRMTTISHIILQPVHASGRYYQIHVNDIGYKEPGCYCKLCFLFREYSCTFKLTAFRLDRLTSGLSLIIPLPAERARLVTEEFVAGTVRKEYISLMSQVSFLRRLNDHSRCLDTI